jgi:hypothetical protein
MRDESGLAFIEFALILPVILLLGLVGIEIANFAIAHQRISQISMMTADNASRLRTQMTESYVKQLFTGVEKAGTELAFKDHGKIILSSVQNNAAGNGQWIRWQRCFGSRAGLSKYGAQGTGQNNSTLADLNGLTAQAGSAVMFVEVSYDYQPVIPHSPLEGTTIGYETAAVVRQRTDFGISGTNTAPCNS